MGSGRMILIIDGQGGGMGAQLVRLLAPEIPDGWQLVCAGSNALATGAMLRAGGAQGATGENAVIYNSGRADVILGPIGIVVANGIMGEISPAMAAAVSGSPARKILIPTASCGIRIAGAEDRRLEDCLRSAAELAMRELSSQQA